MLRVLRALDRAGVEYVLIGATAMGVHGVVRGTEHVDLLLQATAENIRRLRAALAAAYPGDPGARRIRSGDLLGDYPAVRFGPADSDLYLDLLTKLDEFASFESVEAVTTKVEGVRVRVATPRALYRLKAGTLRPLDQRDAAILRRRFDLEEGD